MKPVPLSKGNQLNKYQVSKNDIECKLEENKPY